MAVVVASSSVATGNAGTVAVSKPTGSTSGDMLLAFHAADFGLASAMTAPSGWTQLISVDPGGGTTTSAIRIKVWQADGAVASSTFTNDSGSDSVVVICRITGHDGAATPITAAGSTANTSTAAGTGFDAPSLTPAGSNDLLLCAGGVEGFSVSNASVTWTDPSGMTHVNSGQSTSWTALEVASLALSSSAATGTKTFTPSGTNAYRYGSVSVAIKAAGGTNYTQSPADSIGATDTLPLVPPSHVTATATSASTVDVAWDMVPNVNGYDVERDGTVISTAQAGHTFSDSGLTGSTTYTYNIVSVRSTSGTAD